jgi:hypothetical protein
VFEYGEYLRTKIVTWMKIVVYLDMVTVP